MDGFDTIPETMGKRIRELRRRLNLRQGEVAQAACIKQAYLSDIENDKRTCPQPVILSSIASILGTTLDYLVNGVPPVFKRAQTNESEQQTIPYSDTPTAQPRPEVVWAPVYEDYAYGSGKFPDDVQQYIVRYEPFTKPEGFIGDTVCGLVVRGNSMSDAGIKNGATVLIAVGAKIGNGQPAAVLLGQGRSLVIRYVLKRSDGSTLLKSANSAYGDELLSKEQTEDVFCYREIGPIISVRYQPDWI